MFWSIKCIRNIKYKIYLQNEKMAELWVFVDFCNKRRFEEIYKTSMQNETVRWITLGGVSFLIKLQALGLKLYLKRYPNAGNFPWILWNFLRILFFKEPLCKKELLCFCKKKLYFWGFFCNANIICNILIQLISL